MPIQSNPPLPFSMSKEEEMFVDLEMQNRLEKGCYRNLFPRSKSIHFQHFHHPEERWGEKASGRHARAKSVCRVSSIQDGGYITAEGYPSEGRLHDKAGFARCSFDYSSRSKIKDLLKTFLEGHALSVHMSTIRPLSIGKVVYQDTEAFDCLSKIHGDSSTNLLRRHPHNGRFSRASCRAHRNSDKGLGVSRLCDKEEEVIPEANPDYPVSRFRCKFDKDAPSIARRKTAKIKVICSISSKKCAHSQRSLKFFGSVPDCSASIADGSPPLQGYSERLYSSNFSSRRQGKLQENHKFIGRCNQGSTLVDPRPCTSKWQGDCSSKSRFSNFLRCLKDRMGSSSTRNQHRRMLERARGLRPYKLLGAESSISGSQNFSATDKAESCPVWPGQPHGSSIHQPVGRYKISTPHGIGTRHMVLCSRQEHGDISNSCSREMELHSRWKVQNLSRFDRMDARSQSVQTGNQTSGTLSGGSVCLSGKSSDARVCVMEARTRASMEEPAMVSITPIHAHRTSSALASGSENPEAPKDRQDSPSLLPEEVPVSCMENFQKSLKRKGFPEKVSKSLLSS